MLSGNVLHRPPCGLVDLQYGTKVGGSNRRGLGINRSTQFGHLLSVRARLCLQLQHIPRGATARAKRIPGPHARSSDLRNGAVESPNQCGDVCVLFWNEKLHIPNGTAKAVGSHSVSNTRCHGRMLALVDLFYLNGHAGRRWPTDMGQIKKQVVCSQPVLKQVACIRTALRRWQRRLGVDDLDKAGRLTTTWIKAGRRMTTCLRTG